MQDFAKEKKYIVIVNYLSWNCLPYTWFNENNNFLCILEEVKRKKFSGAFMDQS